MESPDSRAGCLGPQQKAIPGLGQQYKECNESAAGKGWWHVLSIVIISLLVRIKRNPVAKPGSSLAAIRPMRGTPHGFSISEC